MIRLRRETQLRLHGLQLILRLRGLPTGQGLVDLGIDRVINLAHFAVGLGQGFVFFDLAVSYVRTWQ